MGAWARVKLITRVKLLKLPESLGLGQFQQLLKTRVITRNFTRIHCDYLLIT